MDKTTKPVVGEQIVRPVIVRNMAPIGEDTDYRKELGNVEFEKGRKKGVTFCAQRLPELDYRYSVLVDGHGMRCFCTRPVPDDWSHFEIVKVGRNAKSVHVVPVTGADEAVMNLYSMPETIVTDRQRLVAEVAELLKERPDLLPIEDLAAAMDEDQLRKLWVEKLMVTVGWDRDVSESHANTLAEVSTQFIKSASSCEQVASHIWKHSGSDRMYKLIRKAANLRSDFQGVLTSESLA